MNILGAAFLIWCFSQEDFDEQIHSIPHDAYNIKIYNSCEPREERGKCAGIYYQLDEE